MKTHTPKFAITSNKLACASTVLLAKNEILSALKIQTKVILLTGESGKGKSTLLRSIANEISHNHRLIFFDGNDSASSSNDEYKFVKNFICESNQLDERIVIIIDAVELVPEQTLTQFLTAVTASKLKNNNLSVLLSGLPACKEMLDKKLEDLKHTVAHSSLDSIGEEELRFLTAKKDYQIKPNKDEYKFEASALKELSSYVNNDLKLADVALEWCIAIANYSDSDILSSTLIDDAIACIKKFAKDHNIKPSDAYPVVKDVNNYLENHLYNLGDENEVNAERNSPFISKTAFETIDLNERVIPKLDFETDVELDLENETTADTEAIPQEWITTTKKLEPQRKAAYITAFTLCALIVTSFVAIENKPFFDTAFNKIEELNNHDESAAAYEIAPDITTTNDIIDEIDTDVEINDADKVELLATTASEEQITATADTQYKIVEEIQPDTQLAEIYATESNEDTSSFTEFVDIEKEETGTTEVAMTSTTTSTIEIDALLDQAAQQFDTKQLTTPPGDNALESYQKILSLKPGHELAQQGIEKIHARYLNWANYYLKQNETNRSRFFYEKAFEIDPSDLVSKQMADNLKQELSQSDNSIDIEIVPDAQNIDINNKEELQTTINTSSPFHIDGLLTKARQQFRDKQLTTPANNNAYETYREVLKVEPENAAAIQGISQIKKSYINWAETDVKQNELRRAALFYKKALEIDPQDTKIARRLDEITSLSTTNN